MDRNLNRDVALALGWTPTIEVHHFADGAPYEREVWPTESGSLPAFSSYLAAAWTLVELCYSADIRRLSNGAEYEAYLVVERNGANADGYARAETAPKAICMAFLALAAVAVRGEAQ